MRKIFLFIVAALFATTMWAGVGPDPYGHVWPGSSYEQTDPIPGAPVYITDIRYNSETGQLIFNDTYENSITKNRAYTIEVYQRTPGSHIYKINNPHRYTVDYIYVYGWEEKNANGIGYHIASHMPREVKIERPYSTGGIVSVSFAQYIDECYQNGLTNLRIAVEAEASPANGGKVVHYEDGLTYTEGHPYGLHLNSSADLTLAPQCWFVNFQSIVKYGDEFQLRSFIQAGGKTTYKIQESADQSSWQTIKSGILTASEAREGATVQYKKLFLQDGIDGRRYYRIIATENATSLSDTSKIYDVAYYYQWIVNDQPQYKLAGEKISFAKPADCREYKISSKLPVSQKEDGAYVEYTQPACNVWMDEITPKYTVTFLNADYSLLKADTVECGDAAEAPADPTYGNYTFIGWNKDLTNVHSNMSVLAKYDIGNDYDLNVSLDEHKNKVFPFDNFEGNETRAMVGDVLEFSVGIFAVTDASLYYETATWNNSEQRFLWDPNSGKKVGDYKANTTGLLKQEVTVCYDANTQYIHPFEHRLAVRFYLLIAGQRAYSDPYEFDVYYPTGIRTSTAEGVLAENDFGDIVAGTPVMIPARSNDTIRVYGMNGSGGDCFTYRRVIKSSMAVDNGVDEEDNAYFLAPGELDTIVISVAQTAVVFEVTGQGKEEYKKYGNNVYYAEEVDCGGSIAKMPEDPEDAGYIFKGWESWNSSDYPDDAYLNVPAGFTTVGFTAQWEELPEVPQFQVRFYGKDGAPLLKDTLVNEGENAIPPVAPEVSGFHFVGWDKPYTTITANTDITALYGDDAKTWTVTYYDADETTKLGEETVNDGEAAQGIAVVAPEGKHFAYWVEMGTNGIADLTHISVDLEVYAHYDINVYTITYMMDSKEVFSENVNHGNMPTQYQSIQDQGKPSTEQYVYTFDHWNPAIAVATEDATYEAIFTQSLRKYTVRFQNWDHQLLKEEAVEYGKAATAPADPTRGGYTFKGWDRAFNNIITDMTVTALFEKTKEVEQGLEDICIDGDTAQKVLVDGALYIVLPDGKVYNANGLRVR